MRKWWEWVRGVEKRVKIYDGFMNKKRKLAGNGLSDPSRFMPLHPSFSWNSLSREMVFAASLFVI